MERDDGLLRGSRDEREGEMKILNEWNLDTLLDVHIGWLDHAQDVKYSALDALMRIAKKQPEPVAVSPVGLLSKWMFQTSKSSGCQDLRFLEPPLRQRGLSMRTESESRDTTEPGSDAIRVHDGRRVVGSRARIC
jgi:hypothetical protein